MNLADLKNLGGFISPEPEKVEIVWKDHRFDVHIKRLAFGDVERLMSEGGNRSAAMLAACVLLGEGREPLTREDAERLDVSLASKLIDAVNTINGVTANPN